MREFGPSFFSRKELGIPQSRIAVEITLNFLSVHVSPPQLVTWNLRYDILPETRKRAIEPPFHHSYP
jgi:hypothetical protein